MKRHSIVLLWVSVCALLLTTKLSTNLARLVLSYTSLLVLCVLAKLLPPSPFSMLNSSNTCNSSLP